MYIRFRKRHAGCLNDKVKCSDQGHISGFNLSNP